MRRGHRDRDGGGQASSPAAAGGAEAWGKSQSASSLPSIGSLNRMSAVFLPLDEESDESVIEERPGSAGGIMSHLTLNTRDVLRQFREEQEQERSKIETL